MGLGPLVVVLVHADPGSASVDARACIRGPWRGHRSPLRRRRSGPRDVPRRPPPDVEALRDERVLPLSVREALDRSAARTDAPAARRARRRDLDAPVGESHLRLPGALRMAPGRGARDGARSGAAVAGVRLSIAAALAPALQAASAVAGQPTISGVLAFRGHAVTGCRTPGCVLARSLPERALDDWGGHAWRWKRDIFERIIRNPAVFRALLRIAS